MRAEVAAVRATPVVVDATGVGRAVVDLLEALHLTPIAATLTGGGKLRVSGRELSLPRRVLFRPLRAALEVGRLRVAEGCPYRAELAAELLAARGGPSGAESRGAGHHGDLMTAAVLALWWYGLVSTRGHRQGDGPGPRVTGSAGLPSRDGTSDAGARGLGPGVRTAKA